MLRRLLPLSLIASFLTLTACPAPPAGGEGEGEEGEGEAGEGEGEGGEGEGEPPLPTPTATVATSPAFALPADGLSGFVVDVQLAGEAIVDREVVLTASPAGPETLVARSDNSGVVSFTLVSTVPGTFALELSVDDVVLDVNAGEDVAVEFQPCRSLEDAFLLDAWPVAVSRCVGCHNEFGFAPSLGARYVLPFPGDEAFAANGIATLRAMLAFTAADGLDVDVAELDDEQKRVLRVGADDATVPLLLVNPIFPDVRGHTGGLVMSPDEDAEIGRFRSFLARLQAGEEDTCGEGSAAGLVPDDLLSSTTALSAQESFKKAHLTMTGAAASPLTVAGITDETSLAAAIDALLEDPRSETRMIEVWNDWLLTDDNLGQNGQYVGASFPKRFFFERLRSEGATGGNSCDDSIAGNCCRIPEDPLNLDADEDNDVPPKPENVLCEQKRLEIRRSTAREPIEVLLRLWRNDRAAAELVTGDVTVVDPALARVYGLLEADGRTFKDGTTNAFNADPSDDATERRAVRIIETNDNLITDRNAAISQWPHMGILSSPSWLRRYPTTASNRERTRARFVYESLLGVPVMKLAAFATPEIPAGRSLENLTWDTQPCIVCHTLLDPVAATFNHWSGNGGSLTVRRPCRADGMRAPGFGFIALPGSGEEGEGVVRPALDDADDCPVVEADGSGQGAQDTRTPSRLAWLGDRVVEHPRFAFGVSAPLYEGIVGAKLIGAPDALIDPDFEAKARAFATQQKEVQTVAAAFRAGNGRFKPAVKAVLLSRSFRADVTAEVDEATARAQELMGVGSGGLLLTPEVLDRKITSTIGIPWDRLRNPNGNNNLIDEAAYAIFAGGIDSQTVTLRSRDPVAVRAQVARRLGNELSCIAVPQDFSIVDPAQRRLFPLVEITDIPVAADGAVDAAAEAKVRAQIRALHELVWNEAVVDDAEVDASYDLFVAALQAMRAPASGTATPAAIGSTCQAVAAYVPTTGGASRPAYPASGTVVIDGVEHRRVNQDPNFTVRAWMAVLSALLADGRFLFE